MLGAELHTNVPLEFGGLPREMIKENRTKTENRSNTFLFGSSGYSSSSSTVSDLLGEKND